MPTSPEAIAAAKGAVTGLALGGAATYADKGVRVNVVAPGLTRSTLTQRFIATPEAEARSAALIPVNRIAEPDDVAHAFSFLLSPQAAHITGQVLRIDGGQGMLRPLPRAIKGGLSALRPRRVFVILRRGITRHCRDSNFRWIGPRYSARACGRA